MKDVSQLLLPTPVKPVAAIFSADREKIALAARRFEEEVGRIDYVSPETAFDQTRYYEAEMGQPLMKRFFSVEKLMDPADLVEIKVWTVELESSHTLEGKRTFNVDPGYISAERLVLATGKNSTHRIYLGRGVWADLTLVYERGRFRTLPWTYPDYASEAVRRAMTDIRKKYLDQLREMRREEG